MASTTTCQRPYTRNVDDIVVLEGVPGDVDLEPIATRWAAKGAMGDEEYLVAFKVNPSQFKVIRRYSGRQEEGVFEVADDDV